MNLIEYHVLIPAFADPNTALPDPSTALADKPPAVNERLKAAVRRHLIEAVLLRAEHTELTDGENVNGESALRTSFPERELETFLGDRVSAWCSDELRWRILDELLQLRIAPQGDRSILLPGEYRGRGGVDRQLICALAHYGLLAGCSPADHKDCQIPAAVARTARAVRSGDYSPISSQRGDDPYRQALSGACKASTRNPKAIKLERLALLTHRYVWSRLNARRKEFGITRCFLSSTPVDGCYFKKAGAKGTWDLLFGLVLYVDADWQDAFDRYLAEDVHYDLIQDAIYYHKNGLPFMPQLGV